MNKPRRTKFSGLTPLCSLCVFLLTVLVVSSCKSPRTVRGMRDGTAQHSKKTDERIDRRAAYRSKKGKMNKDDAIMTERLFLKTHRLSIELPKGGGMHIDPATGAVIISESVTYTNADNSMGHFDHRDIRADTVFGLDEVVVEARSTFSPEHDGKIFAYFVINVPQALVSPEWRLTLTPEVHEGDTVIHIAPLVIKGDLFAREQAMDYAEYDAFLGSIVSASAYDSVFVDQEGVDLDMRLRHKFYYDRYYREWDRQIAYEEWRKEFEARNAKRVVARMGERLALQNQYRREAREIGLRRVAYGRDTIGFHNEYMQGYHNELAKLERRWSREKEDAVPAEFLDLIDKEGNIDDLYNDIVSVEDSLQIAKNRYEYDKIVDNEVKAARAEDIKLEMITFPYVEGTIDTLLVTESKPIQYLYKYEYPTHIGMNKLDILVKGRVEAVDQSTYTIAVSDTLTYYVASLSQLVDRSLASNETTVYKEAFNRMALNVKFPINGTNFDLDYQDNREQFDKLKSTMNSFRDAGYEIDSIEAFVTTDITGTYEKNANKADKRLETILEAARPYFSEYVNPADYRPKLNKNREDWQGLFNAVRGSDLKNKEGIVQLITDMKSPDDTKKLIRTKYWNDYVRMQKEIFPSLDKVEFGIDMSYPGLEEEKTVIKEEKPEYDRGLELMLARDYEAAFEIMQNHFDYNTALLLACMGYNGKSLEMLQKLDQTGYTEYLQAILKLRMDKEEEALEHLKTACELDPSKVYRTELDPEIMGLVKKYNLNLQALVPAIPTVEESLMNESTDNNATEDIDSTEEEPADDSVADDAANEDVDAEA